jgi:hypothetical protein
VFAVAEKKSKTRLNQLESGKTTKAPDSIPGGRIMTRSIVLHTITTVIRFLGKWIAIDQLYSAVLGLPQHTQKEKQNDEIFHYATVNFF